MSWTCTRRVPDRAKAKSRPSAFLNTTFSIADCRSFKGSGGATATSWPTFASSWGTIAAIRARQRHPLHQLAFVRLARHDRLAAPNPLRRIEAELTLRLRLLLAVAGETVAIRHRLDVWLETRRVRRRELFDAG